MGINYSPPCDGRAQSIAELQQDLLLLSQVTDIVRTFSVSYGLNQIPHLAEQFGLNVVPGAWLSGNATANDEEIERTISLANTHGNVSFLSVGSGTLLRADLTGQPLMEYIDRVRRGVRVPVTRAEPWHVWRDHPELAAAVDLIFVNISPYMDGEPITNAVAFVIQRYSEIREQYPDKPIIISDTGWPSDGPTTGAAVPGLDSQRRFIGDLSAAARARDISFFLDEAMDAQCTLQPGDPAAGSGMFFRAIPRGLLPLPNRVASTICHFRR